MSAGSILVALACMFTWPAAFAQSGAGPHKAASSDSSDVRFTAEVTDGEVFERDIGRDLVFRLIPLGGEASGGWVIEIVPKVQPADDTVEFSGIATPPYHFYNQRYLAGAYGYSTKEAVAITPRHFNFVLSVDDRRIAEAVVNSMLYPSAASDQEKLRIASEAATLHLGHGQLRILRSRVKLGKAGQPDAIAWLKFEVALNFSPGLTLEAVLAPKPPPGR